MLFFKASDAGYGSSGAALRGGALVACGVPALALGGSFLGFGALVRQSGLEVWHGMASTLTAWALPGQVILVELSALGASLAIITLAVALSAARLMPLTMTLVPWLRAPGVPRWRLFLAAHFIAVTGWAVTSRIAPKLPAGERLPFFTGFTLVIWVVSLIATAVGYFLPDALPQRLTLALIFLNPIYFLSIFLGDIGRPNRALSLLLGALLGPLFFLLDPDWSLLLAGLIGGSLAFALGQRRRGRPAEGKGAAS